MILFSFNIYSSFYCCYWFRRLTKYYSFLILCASYMTCYSNLFSYALLRYLFSFFCACLSIFMDSSFICKASCFFFSWISIILILVFSFSPLFSMTRPRALASYCSRFSIRSRFIYSCCSLFSSIRPALCFVSSIFFRARSSSAWRRAIRLWSFFTSISFNSRIFRAWITELTDIILVIWFRFETWDLSKRLLSSFTWSFTI